MWFEAKAMETHNLSRRWSKSTAVAVTAEMLMIALRQRLALHVLRPLSTKRRNHLHVCDQPSRFELRAVFDAWPS